jgi:type IV secretion system protein VirD4
MLPALSDILSGGLPTKEVLLLAGAAACGLVAMAAGSIGLARRRRARRNVGIHGNSRWATARDVKRMGLLDAKGGVYLAGWRGRRGVTHYLRDDSTVHVCVIGPTRSGKSFGPLAMSLLSWDGSVIAVDDKRELWELSAQWRHWHAGNHIHRWEPAALSGSAAWNPLDEVRLGTPHDVSDAQNIAQAIVDPHGEGFDNLDHWGKTSAGLLTGCILHVLYRARAAGRRASLADVAAAVAANSAALWQEMSTNRHLVSGPHPVVAAEGNSQTERSDRERSSVLSTLKTHLMLFADPIIAQNTSDSDFSLADLADGDRPASVYIVTPGTDKERLRPLVRLFLTMATRHLMSAPLMFEDNRQRPAHKHMTLMAIDEMPALLRMEQIEAMLARGAAYGIKCLLSCQAVEQISAIYGDDNGILGNCHIRVCLTPNDVKTAQWLEDLCGQTTAYATHVMESGRRWSGFAQSFNRTIQEVPRPLLPKEDALRLKTAVKDGDNIVEPGEVIVLVAGEYPIRALQSLYFEHPEFVQRARVPA